MTARWSRGAGPWTWHGYGRCGIRIGRPRRLIRGRGTRWGGLWRRLRRSGEGKRGDLKTNRRALAGGRFVPPAANCLKFRRGQRFLGGRRGGRRWTPRRSDAPRRGGCVRRVRRGRKRPRGHAEERR